MRLRGFENGGTWDRLAALQQLVLLADLYKERRDAIDALVAGGAQVVAVEFIQALSWPPSWALFRQDGEYWLTISGTTNLRQMGGHLWGSFAALSAPGPTPALPSVDDVGGVANGAWEALYSTMWPTIRGHLPGDTRGLKLHVSGHSYGAALAQLFGAYFQRDSFATVEVMTFGSPRVWTRGYTGTMPAVCYVIGSTYDPVFHSPPDVSVFWAQFFQGSAQNPFDGGVLGGGVQRVRWEHHGRVEYLLSDGGTVQQTDEHVTVYLTPYVPEFSGASFKFNKEFQRAADGGRAGADLVSTTWLTEHFTANYVGRVLQSYYGGANG